MDGELQDDDGSGAPNNKEETSAVELESAAAPAAASTMDVCRNNGNDSTDDDKQQQPIPVPSCHRCHRHVLCAKPLLLLAAASAVEVATCSSSMCAYFKSSCKKVILYDVTLLHWCVVRERKNI